MQIILIGKGYFNKLKLSQNSNGSYWIADKIENQEIKRLQIEAVDGRYILKYERDIELIKHAYSESSLQFVEQKDDIALEEYDSFDVQFKKSGERFKLFCLPLMENLLHFSLENTQEITIGFADDNIISYKNGLLLELMLY